MRAAIWVPGNSYLHRLNPLTKLGVCIVATIAVSVALSPTVPIIVAALAVLTTHYVGRIPWSTFARPAIFALVVGFGVFWTASVFYGGSSTEAATLFSAGPIQVSSAGVLFGATLATRLFAVMASSAMFVLTSEPTQFVRSLIHQLRVSPRVAYSVFAAYRFVPLVEVELSNIRAAHQMRAGANSGVLGRLRQAAGYAIPLLAIAVRRGERVALAMDSRAFGALPQRTYFRVSTVSWSDVCFIIVSAMILMPLGAYALMDRLSR